MVPVTPGTATADRPPRTDAEQAVDARGRALGLPAALALAGIGGVAYGAGFPPLAATAAP